LDRRELLKSALAGTVAFGFPSLLRAQATGSGINRINDKIAVLDGGGTNVVAFSASDGLFVVDSGVPGNGDKLLAALKTFAPSSKVNTLFNTHYHLDQTGNNESFSAAGAKIIAHDRTRQWMSTDYWIPEENRYQKARPKASWPTQVFFNKESLKIGSDQIEYGYLIHAHTAGDAYVLFKDSDVLVVGDVASPVKDPELDWTTGAWIGGRVDAMDVLLRLSTEKTKFIPGSGPVMTQAEFKAERDVMETVRARLFKQVRSGDGPKDMVEGGVLNGLPRTWKDPYKFLYAAAKGLWGNHNKLDPDVV
jgi:glyoxylase-like metal-dependent hydrolase (beta-lactamase superfamily II)